MKQLRFEVYEGRLGGYWYWRLRGANNRVVADGAEPYATKAGAKKAARRLATLVNLNPPIIEVDG